MKRLFFAAALTCAPATALAGIQDARTGPAARVGSTSTSVGAVLESAAFGEERSLAALVDAQVPLGPLSARLRLPLQMSGPDGPLGKTDAGLGNATIGAATGLELGLGVEAALTLGLDLQLPTQGADQMKLLNLSDYRAFEFARKLTAATPYVVFSIDTPLVDARADIDFLYGVHQADNDDLDAKMVRVGLTGAVSVMPVVEVVVGLDHLRDVGDDPIDPITYARVGVRGGVAVVDFGLEANFNLKGPFKDDRGLGLVASVSAGF